MFLLAHNLIHTFLRFHLALLHPPETYSLILFNLYRKLDVMASLALMQLSTGVGCATEMVAHAYQVQEIV